MLVLFVMMTVPVLPVLYRITSSIAKTLNGEAFAEAGTSGNYRFEHTYSRLWASSYLTVIQTDGTKDLKADDDMQLCTTRKVLARSSPAATRPCLRPLDSISEGPAPGAQKPNSN